MYIQVLYTIIQPNKSQLINVKKAKMKFEIIHQEPCISNRNKCANTLSQLYDSTLPKKNKINQLSAKFYEIATLLRQPNEYSNQETEKKINEKLKRRQVVYHITSLINPSMYHHWNWNR